MKKVFKKDFYYENQPLQHLSISLIDHNKIFSEGEIYNAKYENWYERWLIIKDERGWYIPDDYFYTEQELRKIKLEKIKNFII